MAAAAEAAEQYAPSIAAPMNSAANLTATIAPNAVGLANTATASAAHATVRATTVAHGFTHNLLDRAHASCHSE